MKVDYYKLPNHMQHGAKLYVERGVEPGSFMCAVLSNNLVEAFGRADHVNVEHLGDWASWLYNDCPRQAWGSHEAIEQWISHCGLEGLEEA